MFSGTILENITLHRSEFSVEQVIEVAKFAEAHAFVQTLPLSYNTKVGNAARCCRVGNVSRVGRSPSQWSQPLQTLLDHPPSSLPHRMLLGGLIFSSAFIAWAWFGQISDVSHANGRLLPEGEVYKVQPVIEGEVAKILVKEGQSVRANQVIAELDTHLVAATVERLEKSLADSQLELAQTQGLVAKTQLEKQTRKAIASVQVDLQQSAIHQAADNATTQQRLLKQLQTDIVAYQTQLDRIQPLVKEGAISTDRLFEIEQALRDRQRSIIQTQNAGSSANVLQ